MQCRAKGCCWDNDINKGVLISPVVANRLCMWKVPIAGTVENRFEKWD